MAEQTDYVLIVLDLMLPVMDGMTVCRTLRTQRLHDADPDAHRP